MSVRSLPSWFRQEIPGTSALEAMAHVAKRGVATVCAAAHCPNIAACLEEKKLTFMILGSLCTRHCRFCAVEKNDSAVLSVDPDEPGRISRMVQDLGLTYAVVTSVTRDDLGDGGAGHFAAVVAQIREFNPGTRVELLIPDFLGAGPSLDKIAQAHPAVVAHNVETVPRLYAQVRPEAGYARSLGVLQQLKRIGPGLLTKSSLMVGFGERPEEVIGVMHDLRAVSCDIVTIGQYLAPSPEHYPVQEYISPEQFARYEVTALTLGFKAVRCGPLVRSSYQAEDAYKEASLTGVFQEYPGEKKCMT